MSALLAALVAASCQTPVGVRESGFQPVYRALRENVLDAGHLSESTREVLHYFNLDELYRDDPGQAIAELSTIAGREGLRALQVPIAELHYRTGVVRKDRASFLASAIHAYVFLFSDEFATEPNPYSPAFRLACDLYNRGLARAMLRPSGEVALVEASVETPSGTLTLETTCPGFPLGEHRFSTFLPADRFEVRGLRERVRTSGLGVPLIALQSPEAARSFDAHVGRNIKLPATAFMRLHGGLAELEAGTLRASLELYLGTDMPVVTVAGAEVQLETDISAPLAHMLESSTLWSFGVRGFVSSRTEGYETGVFMLQPYQPDKIPLVFIHGTASSPTTWAQTINGVFADSRLRTRYQVWLCLYNTGNPIAYSAALLRKALQEVVASVDPEGENPALSHTVLVGHSQGGLVARLLITESGDRLWSLFSDTPFDEYPMEERYRDILRSSLFFEPLPFVASAVFISTPHHGSYVAGGWMGRLARKLISFPGDVARAAESLVERRDLPPELRRIPTSVDNMDPDSTFVRNVAELEFGEGIELHSIIAVRGSGDPALGNDGVVDYTSAHLEEARSELVVRHGHTVQGEPETIGELRRILLEHLGGDRAEMDPRAGPTRDL